MEISLMREKKLYDASFRGDIQSLDELLGEDELALNYYERPSPFCFNETPLHVSATRGHVDFAKALLQYKPDLVNEVDSRLRSPLHLASENGHVEMVKLLLKEDADVCLMEDKFGRTPLHLAVMVKGRVEVVNELVRARPEATVYPLNKTKTITILHLYVIRNGPEALKQLVEVDHTFLNSQDGEGNTILHKVVALKKLETLEYLVSKTRRLDVDLKNGNSFTAFDMIEKMPRDSDTTKMRKLLVNFIESTSQCNHMKVNKEKEKLLEEKRNALLVAATVIAGMAYQTGLNPPGGVWDENKYELFLGKNVTFLAGTAKMVHRTTYFGYILFWAFNTVSFVAALSIVLLVIHSKPSWGITWFRVLKKKLLMWFLYAVIYVTMTTMTLTYLLAVIIIAPFDEETEGDQTDWKGTIRIVGWSVVAWLGLIFLIFLVNAYRFFVKVKKFIKGCKNANEGERLCHSNDNTTTCCISV